MGEFVDTRVTVGHGVSSVLIRRLPCQQPGESGSVPGSPGACAGQRHHCGDRSTFPAAGCIETRARQHVHSRRTDGQETAG